MAARVFAAALVASCPAPIAAAPGAPPSAPRPSLTALRPHPAPDDITLPVALRPLRAYLPLIEADARAHGIPGPLLAALVIVASGGNPQAVSPAGAIGLAQVMPLWQPTCGCDLFDPASNLATASTILSRLAARAGASTACLAAGPDGQSAACAAATDRMLAGYNRGRAGGPAPVYSRRIRAAWDRVAA